MAADLVKVGGVGEGWPSPEADAAGAALTAGKDSSSPAPPPGGAEGASGRPLRARSILK